MLGKMRKSRMLRKILRSGLRKEIKTKALASLSHHLGQVFFLIVLIVQQMFCTFPSQQEKLTYKGWENEEQRERRKESRVVQQAAVERGGQSQG